jgi:hypothetical protein
MSGEANGALGLEELPASAFEYKPRGI